jgi:hypothetical protein
MSDERSLSTLQRQKVIDALCEHYAEDRLDVAEFERRLDRVHRAAGSAELREILSDLPALPDSASAVTGSGRTPRQGSHPSVSPGTGVDLHPGGRAPASQQQESQFEFAMWAARERSGQWVPARSIRVAAIMGGVELDFREARFGPDEVRVHVGAFMGGVEIIVPPGVNVVTDGFAFLGAFEEKLAGAGPVPEGAPTVRITGFAFMGAVEVTARLPGESARQARRRIKEEARKRLDDGRRRREEGR